jgi:lipopolysaccharide export system protein LptA
MMQGMTGMTKKIFALITAGTIVLAMPAFAQTLSSLRSHDTKQPIDIDADRFEIRDRDRVAILQGSVKVRQGKLALDSTKMRVFYDRTSAKNPTIKRIDAEGAVRFNSPSENAEAAWGIYDVEERQLTLGGNVKLTRGGNVVQGQRLEVNLITGVTSLDGASGATAQKPNAAKDAGGRVRARFSVPDRK